MGPAIVDVAEQKRLNDAREAQVPWKKWGPYLSERQWGTVREDYSEDGNAWNYFTHDQARSRAYHWGEDGLAGISDDKQLLCFSVALWNGKDPILKERAFGLTNSEANHGEDVKEYYLDLMLQEFFLHPTGQIPAYEWNFSDVNPPVHAWASIFLYRTEQALHGKGDLEFLKRSFAKLMLNFSWWVNRKDRYGNNLFEGG